VNSQTAKELFPPGLSVIQEFLNEEEEKDLLKWIDHEGMGYV